MVANAFKIYYKKKAPTSRWKELYIANWVFYFGGFCSFLFCFALWGEMEEPQPRIWVYVIFGVSCVGCVLLMVLQKIWRIRYDDEMLVFRNSFGVVSRYPMADLYIKERKNVFCLMCLDREVTRWEPCIMNIWASIEFEKALLNAKGR